MGVDVRTRVDGPIDTVDPSRLFGAELVERFDEAAGTLEPAVRWLDPPPLAVHVGDDAWTLSTEDGRVRIRPGAHSEQRLDLTVEALSELVADLVTPMAWFISGALDSNARLERLLD